ncbi:Tim21p [Sugiyamaella lignohabitans]|uniref:Mitochondrial import inner membrane translocase subunit Tim21 n=1 Tax=Sugiyamaella lignohabitans TaxID=796027 RepID=A0A167DBI7_9ASCO|nr:Tim21p [Sugiyamaella lignohabitans]ANB12719.1 Tim21p [Sugiyamaella lignohabitans]
MFPLARLLAPRMGSRSIYKLSNIAIINSKTFSASPVQKLNGKPISHRSFTAMRSILNTASSTASSSSSAKSKANTIPLTTRISSAFSFIFASGLVIGGIGLTGIVIYYFVNDILLPTSDVQIFNKAFSIIEKDPQCQKLLGGSKIKAYGEETSSKWGNRNRPIASRRGMDGRGLEHVLMHFHVKGDIAEGVARLEMIESGEKSSLGIGKFDFRYLVVEVPGSPRVYLIDNSNKPKAKDPNAGFLGVRWGPKKDV